GRVLCPTAARGILQPRRQVLPGALMSPLPFAPRFRLQGAGVLALLLLAGRGAFAEPGKLRRGLVVAHADAGKPPLVIHTLDPLPVMNLKAVESPHPRLGPGGGSAWKGFLQVAEEGEYRFEAILRGSVKLAVAGKPVLTATVKEAAPAS